MHLLGISAIVRFARRVESMESGSSSSSCPNLEFAESFNLETKLGLTLASTARNFQILSRRFLLLAYCPATLITNCQFEKVPEVLSGGVQLLSISICCHRQASSVGMEEED